MNTEKANQVLQQVAKEFSQYDKIPQYIASAYIQCPEVPSAKWSTSNKLLMVLSETQDARGYKQWQEAGRYVKKGAKAFYILAPRQIKKTTKDDKDQDKEENITIGFRVVPVFRYEDTDGKPLEEYKPKTIPPLADLAKIRYANSDHGELGSWSPSQQEITLSTEDPAVYLHELMHQYDKTPRTVQKGQDPEREIIAELGACVLCRLYNVETKESNHMSYIASYAENKTPEQVGTTCLRVANKVTTAIQAIMADATAQSQ